jgi:uncharacterized protein (TIGR03437 family)
LSNVLLTALLTCLAVPGQVQFTPQLIWGLSTPGTITTLAGTAYFGYGGDNGPARAALLSSPFALALDGSGNIYIADWGNQAIRRIDRLTGIITTIVGHKAGDYVGDGGPAAFALLSTAFGVAVGPSGNIYIADSALNLIRKIDSKTGIITTVAGVFGGGYGGDGGPATSAGLLYPYGVAVDNAENIYIADSNNAEIRKVSADTGIITTVAGHRPVPNGPAPSGDDGPATAAALGRPVSIAIDSSGNFYFADDFACRVRKVTVATGIIRTIAGTGVCGLSGNGGPATSAEVIPNSVAVDASGNVFIGNLPAGAGGEIRRIDAATGIITSIAGTNSTTVLEADGQPALDAALDGPYGLAVDPSGNLYVDDGNRVLFLLNSASKLAAQTIAFDAIPNVTYPAVPFPLVAAASSGLPVNLISLTPGVCALYGNILSPVASGTCSIIAVQGGNSVYGIADSVVQTFLVELAAPSWGTTINQEIVTIAGNGNLGYAGDGGPATGATLFGPAGVAVGESGAVAIADTANHRVRRLDPATGILTTVAGNGTRGSSGDGGPALSAQLDAPMAVAVDPVGNIYVAESAVRKISAATGIISTVPGTSGASGLAVDSQGNLYIAFEGEIQKVDGASGIITTVAGGGNFGNFPSTTPAPATSVFLEGDLSVAVDRAGNVYIVSTVVQGSPVSALFKVSAASGNLTSILGISNLPNPNGLPLGIAVDNSENVYISDGYKRILMFDSGSQTVAAFAGVGGPGYAGYGGDGGPAIASELNFPGGIAVDNNGNLYIADTGNSRIRFVPHTSYPAVISDISPAPASIVNAAAGGQAVAGIVAAGSYVAIYGTNLAGEGLPSASTLPLPTTLNGTQLLFGGVPMPMLYASSTQVNALVPEGLVANTQYSLVVTNGGLQSSAMPVTAVGFQPGIYTVDGSGSGDGVITDAISGSLLGRTNPAHLGDLISIYCTGLGAVRGANGESAPSDGNAALSNTLYTTTATVTATIEGVNAPVLFAGLAPTFAGLYQLNVQVPSGIITGSNVPLVIQVTDQASGVSAKSNVVSVALQ